MSNNSGYHRLIQKLDQFIRKYYVNQLIKGAIFSLAFIIGLFLIVNLVEYRLYLSSGLRKVLFYGFLASSLLVLGNYVFRPLLGLFKLGKIISHELAAQIVGKHFSEVKDKLINVLQLKDQANSGTSTELILASIDQKSDELKPVKFVAAIDLAGNKKHLKFLLPPLMVLVIILFAQPNIIKEGSERLIRNNDHFEREMPFSFDLIQKNLEVLQYEDFTLEVEINGEVLPEEVVVVSGDRQLHRMKRKKRKNLFEVTFKNVRSDLQFQLEAAGFRSENLLLKMLPKPVMTGMSVSIDYPRYTGRKDEVLNDIGDLVVPEGSYITWHFEAENTAAIRFHQEDSVYEAQRIGTSEFQFGMAARESAQYLVRMHNDHVKTADSMSYNVAIIPDQYPAIQLSEQRDSNSNHFVYFIGEISDDYGLRNLQFRYQIERADSGGKRSKLKSNPVSFSQSQKIAQFNHFWNTKEAKLKPGDKLSYYFEVWDNDGVNGSKSTKSGLMIYQMPTIDEYKELAEASNEAVKKRLDEAIKKSKQLQDDIKDVKEKVIDKKELSWEDKQQISELVKKQQSIKEELKELNNEFSENLERQEEFKEVSEEIREKQEKLEEMFESLMSDEMKELFEKMESMLEELARDEAIEDLDDFELTNEQLEKELDRMLELFKKLEFEQKLTETIDELNDLAEQEEQLSEESAKEGADQEALQEKQKEIAEKFEKLKEELGELNEMNEEIGGDENEFSENQEQADQVSEEMQKSQENLEKGKSGKASENQKKASDEMKKMAEDMASKMQSMQMEQMAEDMDALRQLLENLVLLSFEQEEVMHDIKSIGINTPKYVELVQKQHKIQDDSEMVEDSLYALAKRVFQLESFITKEVGELKKHLQKSIRQLEDRKVGKATAEQQYAMTSYNNLALMLSETMEAMQQQMAQQMPGSQMCQKPNSSGPGKLPKLGQMQQQLNDQMKKMAEQMKGGKMPGKGMSKELAKMAAKQAAIRNALKEVNDAENKDGKNSLGNLNELSEQMERSETELVNKQLTQELMMRQQEIMTRLLEAAEAERQRELDKKRESKTGQEMARDIPPALEEYMKQRQSEIELYKTVPPSLRPYYKSLVEKYFRNITFNN